MPSGNAGAVGDALEPSEARWRKARSSGSENGGCVEIAGGLSGVTAIRDSRRRLDGAHFVSKGAFAAFLADVKTGAYDIQIGAGRAGPEAGRTGSGPGSRKPDSPEPDDAN
jgi:hypothetical protein